MSEYTTSDLCCSLEIVEIARETIEKVHYGWGHSPEGYGSWEGGFILELKDGRFVKLTGWCDTTGWGCQDGSEVTYHDTLPKVPDDLRERDWSFNPGQPIVADHLPADLNRWVQGEFDVD
jgi:hypothetical protein